MAGPRYLDQQLFAELASRAGYAPRGRQHHSFHRMEEPATAWRWTSNEPHPAAPAPGCRQGRALIVLKRAVSACWSSTPDGELLDKRRLSAAGVPGVDLPPGVFHALWWCWAGQHPVPNARPGVPPARRRRVRQLSASEEQRRCAGLPGLDAPSSPERFASAAGRQPC